MSADDFELVTLRNGFRAVRHKGHDEVMHPSVGPWAEAKALYVEQARLAERLRERTSTFRILDVGLGAAANAVAALDCWKGVAESRPLEIHSFEIDLTPLKLALDDAEGFPFLQSWRAELVELMDHGWLRRPGLEWKLYLGDARERLQQLSSRVHLVFHDPFSPESNEPLWSPSMFWQLLQLGDADEGCELYTYSASTRTRVSMLLGGWFVGVGAPIGTKQETTVASNSRPRLLKPLDARWLERYGRSGARDPYGEVVSDAEQRIRSHPQFR